MESQLAGTTPIQIGQRGITKSTEEIDKIPGFYFDKFQTPLLVLLIVQIQKCLMTNFQDDIL